MATSDWLRSFDFDRVFWSTPGRPSKGAEEGKGNDLASEQATQQSVFKGLGEKIVEDALNVSQSVCPRSVLIKDCLSCRFDTSVRERGPRLSVPDSACGPNAACFPSFSTVAAAAYGR